MTDQNSQPLTRKALREQAEAIARKQAEAESKVAEEVVKQVEVDDEGNPQFKVSSNMTDPTPTSNIVITPPEDITAGGAIITDAGELVITDSIDISALITQTGEIDVIQIDSSEDDLDRDAQKNYIPGIPPIRVAGIIAKTESQPGIPGGAHKGLNPYVYISLLALAGILIAGGVAIAYFSGFFNN